MVPGGGLGGTPDSLAVIPGKGVERRVTLQAIQLLASRTGWRGRLILRPFAFFAPLREPNYFAQRRKDTKKGKAGFPRTRERSEEQTSELQSLMRISYAVFRLKTKPTPEY